MMRIGLWKRIARERRLPHKVSTFQNCGQMRAVCRTSSAHEAHDEHSKDVVVEEVWCVAVDKSQSDCIEHAATEEKMPMRLLGWSMWRRRGCLKLELTHT